MVPDTSPSSPEPIPAPSIPLHAVTFALPSIVIVPDISPSSPAPIPAPSQPLPAVTCALPLMVMLPPDILPSSPEPIPAPFSWLKALTFAFSSMVMLPDILPSLPEPMPAPSPKKSSSPSSSMVTVALPVIWILPDMSSFLWLPILALWLLLSSLSPISAFREPLPVMVTSPSETCRAEPLSEKILLSPSSVMFALELPTSMASPVLLMFIS